ncbi:protein PAL OF QUIRKY [Musa acuminata AAA Group]|uniref:protein PAL OF QUIRKY n=1 Tax=Musa acuminata AAA Group TaxID=214697 RepID=UPI0031D48A7F
MVGALSSSSSSCASFGSFEEDVPAAAKPSPGAASVKFLCSYGGRILPRYPDGKLRYVGGDTRVLSVDRSVPFSELREKMRELCGWGAVSVRCQLPTEDLDALVSVKSDEDLTNVVEEYDLAAREKIRAFLFPPSNKGGGESPTHRATPISVAVPAEHCVHQISAPARPAGRFEKPPAAGDLRHHGHGHHHHLHGRHAAPRPCNYLVHHGSHWQ